MYLMNNETKMDITLSDMYIGLRMLARVQSERRVDAIKRMAAKSKQIQSGAFNKVVGKLQKRRSSMMVLDLTDSGSYEVDERQLLLDTNDDDQSLMNDAAHFVKYASYIYVKLKSTLATDFMLGEELECFIRPLDTLFQQDYQLANIGLNNTFLCYASFKNGMLETPYAIMVDEEVQNIVIVVRGTRSLEDLVVDLQFVPDSLAEVGRVCGFIGDGYYCHQGFLLRSKWMYNDIKKQQVLKTLFSSESPYKSYSLVVTGHSLGAGCASILALMLRPAFESLHCFAYEVSEHDFID
jgi:sn1-specific diacylglycerol lipase